MTKRTLGVRVAPRRVRSSVSSKVPGKATSSSIRTSSLATAKTHRDLAQKTLQDAVESMPGDMRAAYNQLRDLANPTPTDDPNEAAWQDVEADDLDDDLNAAINGTGHMGHSSAGGEFMDTLEAALRKERAANRKRGSPDRRKRRDLIIKQVRAFDTQMDAMTDTYLSWSTQMGDTLEGTLPEPPSEQVAEYYSITVVDVFYTAKQKLPMLYTGKFTISCLVGRGVVPCSPWKPTVGFSIRLLELFRLAHVRTPALSIQSWVKTIADLHGQPFKPYQMQQFSIAYDLYLAIRRRVKSRVDRALGRDASDWRLKNCCPACMYKLEGEEELEFSMLVAIDGNDSLKRVLRRGAAFDDDGNPLPPGSKERFDPRTETIGREYFLPREAVNRWSKEALKEAQAAPSGVSTTDKTVCEERWKNLSEELTQKMWGVYDETGIFVCLCRHSFLLMVADMVKSGELAKYPLAVAEKLLDVFDAGTGCGYDIGCGFETTLRNSPLGPSALLQNFRCLVGAFHGHAHNRRCQLSYLPTYIPGIGLEDLEGCERYFSHSNAMAGSVRYASIFHRIQTLVTYFEHYDTHETYANLSKFLVDNYWQ